MQRIAFIPDGLNEFLYAPNGVAECSTSQPKFITPVPLGAPDIEGSGPSDPSLRMDRELGSIGRAGTTGTIAELGALAVAIPPYTRYQNDATWLKKELVAVGPNGKVWSIAGDRGLYQRLSKPAHFAWVCATNIIAWLNRYWSFEARFNRHLNAQSVVVAYQPIIDLRSGEVSGCEVLARWRDVDGTIVAPNRFIEIVARTGRTAAFTQMVADRAYEELGRHIPRDMRLEINFNVFACDLDSARLLRIFSRFLEGKRQFDLAVELVESQEIDFEEAQRTIQELARAGVRTYIDDFGTGYSSIERVATLAVHGVKLDRSFAMSPPDSIMGQMLVQVLEMIKTSGRMIVVEGVETEARLNLLRSIGIVDGVQGYVISRPLGIDQFIAFLGKDTTAWRARDFAA